MVRSNQPQSNTTIDIISLWHALSQGFQTLLTLTALTGLVTFGILSLIPPRYSSEAQLEILAKNAAPVSGTKAGQATAESELKRTEREHIEAIQNPDLLLKIADNLSLSKKREFGAAGKATPNGTPPSIVEIPQVRSLSNASEQQILNTIAERLQVTAIDETRRISIRFASVDADLAADFVNNLAESYRQSLVGFSSQDQGTEPPLNTLVPSIGLASTLEQLNREVREAEQAVERFRAQTDRQSAAGLNEELAQAETELTSARSKWRSAEDLKQSGAFEAIPEVQNSLVIRKLIARRNYVARQRAEARVLLSSAHPRLQQLAVDFEDINRSIRREVSNVVSSLEKRFYSAQEHIQRIRSKLVEIQPQVADFKSDQKRLKTLESQAKLKRLELERLQRQLENEQKRVSTSPVPSVVRIVSYGSPGSEPTFPKKMPYTLLTMAAIFMLGIALVTAREMVNTIEDKNTDKDGPVTPQPQVPLSLITSDLQPANINETNKTAASSANATYSSVAADRDDAQSPKFQSIDLKEAETKTIGELAARILGNAQNIAGYRTMLAGENQNIDAAREGMLLAEALSRRGKKTAILEWNINEEPGAQKLGFSIKGGISEFLTGSASYEDIITEMPKSRVHYVVASNGSKFDGDDLDTDGLITVLDVLDENYDHLIVIGRFDAAQALFETTNGNFDTGIIVTETEGSAVKFEDGVNFFLGFEATKVEVILYSRPLAITQSSKT